MPNSEPELGRLRLALVDQRLLQVVGGVELRELLGGSSGLGLRLVVGEFAAVLGLDSPETLLLIHLGSRVLPDPSNQIGVPAGRPWLLSCRRHCLLLS